MAGENIVEITMANFEEQVIKSDIPVIIDFWAQWCGPCRMVAPVMEQLAQDYDGRLKVGKVNVDEEGEIAAQYRIMSIPTIMLFKNGEIVERLIGARPKEDFAKAIDKHI